MVNLDREITKRKAAKAFDSLLERKSSVLGRLQKLRQRSIAVSDRATITKHTVASVTRPVRERIQAEDAQQRISSRGIASNIASRIKSKIDSMQENAEPTPFSPRQYSNPYLNQDVRPSPFLNRQDNPSVWTQQQTGNSPFVARRKR